MQGEKITSMDLNNKTIALYLPDVITLYEIIQAPG